MRKFAAAVLMLPVFAFTMIVDVVTITAMFPVFLCIVVWSGTVAWLLARPEPFDWGVFGCYFFFATRGAWRFLTGDHDEHSYT